MTILLVEVHWNDKEGYLFSPKPREWSYLDWYKHIIGVVKDEYGYNYLAVPLLPILRRLFQFILFLRFAHLYFGVFLGAGNGHRNAEDAERW